MKRVRNGVVSIALRKGWTLALAAGLLAGCVTNPGDTQNLRQHGGTNPVIIKSKAASDANRAANIRTVRIRSVYHTDYVSLSEAALAAGYHGAWMNDGKTYGIGDNDVIWKFRDGESRFTKAGKTYPMSAPSVREKGRLLVPASALKQMFGHESALSAGSQEITFLPRRTDRETGTDGTSLPFTDKLRIKQALDTDPSAAIIAYAKQFLGTPYEFGAPAHLADGMADCSSFVQHVFDHFGVSLPRDSRQQSQQGVPVSRDELLPGDLLFFNVPGRFKSQDTVGHVGIYMGDGQMIHASPANGIGVQISDINKPYYLRTFLYAKRVLP